MLAPCDPRSDLALPSQPITALPGLWQLGTSQRSPEGRSSGAVGAVGAPGGAMWLVTMAMGGEWLWNGMVSEGRSGLMV